MHFKWCALGKLFCIHMGWNFLSNQIRFGIQYHYYHFMLAGYGKGFLHFCVVFIFTHKTVWSVWYRRTCFNLQDCETYFVFENAYRVYNFHNPFLFSSCWDSHLLEGFLLYQRAIVCTYVCSEFSSTEFSQICSRVSMHGIAALVKVKCFHF